MNDDSYPLAESPDAHAASTPAPGVGLSIVIPVYRGAATIGRLVDALSALQPAGGLEVVLVNDGSPDNSGEVCRELVRRAFLAHIAGVVGAAVIDQPDLHPTDRAAARTGHRPGVLWLRLRDTPG